MNSVCQNSCFFRFYISILLIFSTAIVGTPKIYCQVKDAKIVASTLLHQGAKINIDGLLDEEHWGAAIVATNFIVYDPDFGNKPHHQTEAKFLHDDYGLYIGLTMRDTAPYSIYKDLSMRDDEGNGDWIAIYLSPTNDGQNGFMFKVTAAGVQIDKKIIIDGEADDLSWDGVWFSKTSISDSGWHAEILIPWSTLRFPNSDEQQWDINIMREIRKYREQSTWNPVDKTKHGFLTQSGKLIGLDNLKSPVRLSILPYISTFAQKSINSKKHAPNFNVGMDLKYGILNNYTLDLTLVPDFGQVKWDDEIYNFSPFEVKYSENRPFFTEGTEFFTKTGIFYSRRVGQRPAGYDKVHYQIGESDSIIKNPTETQLINATKFSGRGSNGLAIGIFNAITGKSTAILSDSAGNEYSIETQSLANYNMVVIDKSLPNNSFINIANTNLQRAGYNADVAATTFRLKTKNQKHALSGDGAASKISQKGGNVPTGYKYGLSISKISGTLRWNIGHSVTEKNYNPNDMGYNTITDIATTTGSIGYYQYEPKGSFLKREMELFSNYNMLFSNFSKTTWINGAGLYTTLKNRLSVGGKYEIAIGEKSDYYESRVPGRVYTEPGYSSLNCWLSPDYRKKFLMDFDVALWKNRDTIQKGFVLTLSPRFRASNRAVIYSSLSLSRDMPALGYADNTNIQGADIIIFGARKANITTVTLSLDYALTPLSSLTLRGRHYWVTNTYLHFFELLESGYLVPIFYTNNYDFTLNIFNIDFNYQWNFAPGSFLNINYKLALNKNEEHVVNSKYLNNIKGIASSPSVSFASIKLIYYIDYESVIRKLKKTTQ